MREETGEIVETGVLVVGGGAAACMAAISAHREGASVVVVDKGQLGKSGCSPNAHGGMAVFHKHPNDSWRIHLEDSLMSGGFLNNQHIVEVMCKEAYRFVQTLEQFGSLFDRDADGTYSVRRFGGHRYSRSVFSGDETGHEMMNGLKREILRRNIKVMDDVMATRVLTHDGSAVGAVCLDFATGKIVHVKAPCVVLATADCSGIWPAASERQRGDGYILALEAGAELSDMEFIQYHPTHAWWPYGVRGSVSESFRSEGGHLINSEGERFMKRYDPENMELATRDKVSVAIYKEIRAGRGAAHGGIYASVAHLPPDHIKRRLRVIFRKYMSYGYDIRKDPIEVRPRPHYHCGGVRINTKGETTIPGLYAAGAVASGVHGGNRLGSNALVDILVFGEIAGRNAAQRSLTHEGIVPEVAGQLAEERKRIFSLTDKAPDKPLTVPSLRRKHVEMMDKHMGVLRTEDGMKLMLEEVERAKREDIPNIVVRSKNHIFNFELRDALEMLLRIQIEEMATRAALMRKESRASHYREDYPTRNDKEWLKNIVFFKRDGELKWEIRDVEFPIVKLENLPEYAASDSPWH